MRFRSALSMIFASVGACAAPHQVMPLAVPRGEQVTSADVDRVWIAHDAVREGVAELVAELITNRKPALPVYTHGPAHEAAIKTRFVVEMNQDDYNNWLWNSAKNPFSVS